MLFMVKNRYLLVLLLCLCFLTNACGQTEEQKQKLAAEYRDSAYKLRDQGKTDLALKEFLKAIELTPDDAESYVVLSGIYMDLEDWQKAVESAQKAVDLKPNYSNAHYTLAVMSQRTGDFKKAVNEFEKANNLSPLDTNILINLGGAYEETNKRTSARKCYEKALEIDAEYVPAIYLLGELEKEDGKFENAIKLFKKASEIKIPENRQAEQSGSQRDAKKRLEELQAKKKP